jgi:hypothetical protein
MTVELRFPSRRDSAGRVPASGHCSAASDAVDGRHKKSPHPSGRRTINHYSIVVLCCGEDRRHHQAAPTSPAQKRDITSVQRHHQRKSATSPAQKRDITRQRRHHRPSMMEYLREKLLCSL